MFFSVGFKWLKTSGPLPSMHAAISRSSRSDCSVDTLSRGPKLAFQTPAALARTCSCSNPLCTAALAFSLAKLTRALTSDPFTGGATFSSPAHRRGAPPTLGSGDNSTLGSGFLAENVGSARGRTERIPSLASIVRPLGLGVPHSVSRLKAPIATATAAGMLPRGDPGATELAAEGDGESTGGVRDQVENAGGVNDWVERPDSSPALVSAAFGVGAPKSLNCEGLLANALAGSSGVRFGGPPHRSSL